MFDMLTSKGTTLITVTIAMLLVLVVISLFKLLSLK